MAAAAESVRLLSAVSTVARRLVAQLVRRHCHRYAGAYGGIVGRLLHDRRPLGSGRSWWRRAGAGAPTATGAGRARGMLLAASSGTVGARPDRRSGGDGDDDGTTTPSQSPKEPANRAGRILTVPNLLSLARMLVAPYIGILVTQHRFAAALGLLVAAAITDALDGMIARAFAGQRSVLGTVLDPLADKALMASLTVSLCAAGLLPGAPAAMAACVPAGAWRR